MGWYYGYGSRRELIDYLTKTTESEHYKFEFLAKCFVGNNMWTVCQRTNKQAGCPADKREIKFIVLYLLRRGGREDWGYKDVSEDMGPCEVNCPLKYLDMAPNGADGSEYARNWRQNVREYWKAKADGRDKAAHMLIGHLFRKGSSIYRYHGPYMGRYGRKATGDIVYNEYPAGRTYRMKPIGIAPLSPEETAWVRHEAQDLVKAVGDLAEQVVVTTAD